MHSFLQRNSLSLVEVRVCACARVRVCACVCDNATQYEKCRMEPTWEKGHLDNSRLFTYYFKVYKRGHKKLKTINKTIVLASFSTKAC